MFRVCVCVYVCVFALKHCSGQTVSSGLSYNTIQSVMRGGLHDAVRGRGKEERMERTKRIKVVKERESEGYMERRAV